MNLEDLKKPFAPEDILWRIQVAKLKQGKPWGRCLAYVDARAIQNRLDQVCGIAGWSVEYKQVEGGFLCGLSLFTGPNQGMLLTKWDGSDPTDTEPFKGGISKAFVRAASVWGIGRYLYDIPVGWAVFGPQTEKTQEAKIENQYFHWLPPSLPDWALPKKSNEDLRSDVLGCHPANSSGLGSMTTPQASPKPSQASNGPLGSPSYVVQFGKYKGRTVESIDSVELLDYINFLTGRAEKEGKPLGGVVRAFVDEASAYLGNLENAQIAALQGDVGFQGELEA